MLNSDLWLEIMTCFEDPRDIVRLRMVSQFLYIITFGRSVWLHVLKNQCVVNYAPLCSFAFDSMDARQLEQAAIRPELFLGKITSRDSLRLRETRVELTSTSESYEEYGAVTSFCPIPGGRFALSSSSLDWILVWDLGHETRESTHPVLIKGLKLPSRPRPGMLHALPVDGISIIRIVFSVYQPAGWGVFQFIVDLNGPRGVFQEFQEATTVFEGQRYWQNVFISPHGQIALQKDGDCVIVRDLVHNKWGLIKNPAYSVSRMAYLLAGLAEKISDQHFVFVNLVLRFSDNDAKGTQVHSYTVRLYTSLEGARAHPTTITSHVMPLGDGLNQATTPSSLSGTLGSSGEMIIFSSSKGTGRLYRMGLVGNNDSPNGSVRCLVPVEHLSKPLIPELEEYVVLFRKRLTVFWIERVWPPWQLCAQHIDLLNELPTMLPAEHPSHALSAIPGDLLMSDNFSLDLWRGIVYLSPDMDADDFEASPQARGVTAFQFMDAI